MSHAARLIVALLAGAGVEVPRPTAEPPSTLAAVTLHTRDGAITLSPDEARSLERLLRIAVQHCSFNSIETPEVFRHLEPARAWAERAARPHVAARFDTPIEIALAHGGTHRATELLLPRPADYWLARDGESILILGKCSGTADVLLDCTPALRPHLRPDEVLCKLAQESVAPRPRPAP